VQLERAAGAAELLVQLVVRERAPVIVEAVQPCAGGADLPAQRAPELLEVDVRRGDVC
jgi:hypothetical protein